jgi:hypothetical protein
VLPTAERSVVVPRLTSLNHVDVIGAEDDVQDISDGPITPHAPVWGPDARSSNWRRWPCGWR